MVVDCPKCGKHAYATRFKDSALSVCRNCRWFKDAITGETGFDLQHDINDSFIEPLPEDHHWYEEDDWDWEPHQPGDGRVDE